MNLKTMQKRYRVYLEDGASHKDKEVWRYYEVRGARGSIHPYSQTKLCVLIRPGGTSMDVIRAGKWELIRDTDDGREFLIGMADFSEAAELIQARRKRQVSPEQRAVYVERLRQYGFKKKPPRTREAS